ncbi:hypothetical protein KFL_007280010, partial [Klebsormidium nitens]
MDARSAYDRLQVWFGMDWSGIDALAPKPGVLSPFKLLVASVMQEAWPYVTRLASELDDIFFLMPFTWKQLAKFTDQRTPADVPIIAVPIDAEDYPVPNRVPGSILFRIEVQNRRSNRDNGSLWVELPAEKDFPFAEISDGWE